MMDSPEKSEQKNAAPEGCGQIDGGGCSACPPVDKKCLEEYIPYGKNIRNAVMRRSAQIIAGIVLAGILISGGDGDAETAPAQEPAAVEKKTSQAPLGKAKSKAKSKKRKRAASKCDLRGIKYLNTLDKSVIDSIKPLPGNLSDECYCQTVMKRYVNPETSWPTIDTDVEGHLYRHDYRAFKCVATHFYKAAGLRIIRRECLDEKTPRHTLKEWECDPVKGFITFAPPPRKARTP